MAEYIEREALYQSLKKLADETDCNIAVLPDVADLIREAPAADVAPVRRGRWEDCGSLVCCSVCGVPWLRPDKVNNGETDPSEFYYCPYCGARMDEEIKHD